MYISWVSVHYFIFVGVKSGKGCAIERTRLSNVSKVAMWSSFQERRSSFSHKRETNNENIFGP